jgi:hypothetical protein
VSEKSSYTDTLLLLLLLPLLPVRLVSTRLGVLVLSGLSLEPLLFFLFAIHENE